MYQFSVRWHNFFTRFLDAVLGLILLVSSVEHINNSFVFLAKVLDYQIVHGVVALIVAAALPPAQFIVGVCLVAGIARRGAICISSCMFFVYGIAQVSALLRGLSIDCGCFGRISGRVSVGSVMFVTILFLFSLIAMVWGFRERRPMEVVSG